MKTKLLISILFYYFILLSNTLNAQQEEFELWGTTTVQKTLNCRV